MQKNGSSTVAGKELVISGRVIRTARLRDEYYDHVEDPTSFMGQLRDSGLKADVFSFVQEVHDTTPRYSFTTDRDPIAVLPVSTYEDWWKSIKDKSRNMVRKSQKNGVTVRIVPFGDDLIKGIMSIYNESPIRQGRKHWHYGKEFDVVRREHQTFTDISDFVGAYHNEELIGFAKITHLKNYSVVMNIMSKICHRDKAPTNALIAKAVEICAQRKVSHLKYGVWGRRGLNDFKVHNGFKCFEVPRYYVALNLKGKLALKFNLHRELTEYLPESIVNLAATLRTKWTVFRYGEKNPAPATASKTSV